VSVTRGLMRLGSVALSSILCTSALAAQGDAVEWRVGPDVTSGDKKSIVELARNVGIDHPRRVANSTALPPGCHVVTVSSDVTLDGNHVSWTGIDLLRADSKNCWPQRDAPARVGRWLANTPRPWVEERWRVRDGDWHVDIDLDEGVPYRDAERIVLAIHRKELVNRLPERTTLPDIDAGAITSIQKRNGTSASEYRVTFGTGARGVVFDVRLADSRVELYGVRALAEI